MEINLSEIVKAVAQKIQQESGERGISDRQIQDIVNRIEQSSRLQSSTPTAEEAAPPAQKEPSVRSGGYIYPLAKHHPDELWSKTGKAFSEITFDKVIQGTIGHEDFKTNAKTLLMQADIAEKAGKKQFAENLRRAAELTQVPDEEVLQIYNKLRPNRATKQELLEIAQNLRNRYQANQTANLIEETAQIYEKRNILLS